MEKELISVIIPVYNQSETLYSTIESVINQNYNNIEIIVVDDGSDQDIESIVNIFNNNYIIFLKQEHQNANVARNLGINNSRGKYIAMLDGDDLWLKTHLHDCLDVLKQDQVDGLYGSLILKNANQEAIVYARKPNKHESMIDYLLSTMSGAQTSTLFLTSSSAKDILWDERLKRHQDYDFIIRYSKKYKLAPKEKPTVIYNIRIKDQPIDFESCIRFIKEHEDNINPIIYNQYNHRMLSLALRTNADPTIIKYYQQEATFHKEYLSFLEYLQIRQPKNKYQILKYKFQYILRILRIQIE